MEEYFLSSASWNSDSPNVGSSFNPNPPIYLNLDSSDDEVDVNFDEFPSDPGLRKNIYDYDVNDRERVRRSYLLKGPCQPKTHTFPSTVIGAQNADLFLDGLMIMLLG